MPPECVSYCRRPDTSPVRIRVRRFAGCSCRHTPSSPKGGASARGYRSSRLRHSPNGGSDATCAALRRGCAGGAVRRARTAAWHAPRCDGQRMVPAGCRPGDAMEASPVQKDGRLLRGTIGVSPRGAERAGLGRPRGATRMPCGGMAVTQEPSRSRRALQSGLPMQRTESAECRGGGRLNSAAEAGSLSRLPYAGCPPPQRAVAGGSDGCRKQPGLPAGRARLVGWPQDATRMPFGWLAVTSHDLNRFQPEGPTPASAPVRRR